MEVTSVELRAGTKVIVNGHYPGTITELIPNGFNFYVDGTGEERTCYFATDSYRTSTRGMTADELSLMKHISMFGSSGYPVRKLGKGSHWVWDYRTVKGPPTVFKTKREAVANFEAFMEVLRDAYAGRV